MTKEKVFLYLYNLAATEASWVIIDENNAIIQSQLHTSLEQLVISTTTEVIAIIPATDVLLTQADLPKMNSYRLHQAIPFAIEEQLLDDVSQLHCATGEYTNGHYPVVVINLILMTAWLDYLKKFNIQPQQLIPASLAIPIIKNHWSVYCFAETCLVRTDDFSGFSCENENLSDYLKIKLAESLVLPEQIDLYIIDNTNISVNSTITCVSQLISEKSFLESLAILLQTRSYINLLQNSFKPKHQSKQGKKLWRYAAYITATWITLGLSSYLILFLILDYYEFKLNQQIETVYHRYFPDAVTMIAPRERMMNQLKKSSNQTTNASFLGLLATIGQAITQSKSTHLQSLDYRDKLLSLTLLSNTFDQVDKLIHVLQAQGLKVRQQSAEAMTNNVKVTLLVNAA
jgi:general secretion pathway protein L